MNSFLQHLVVRNMASPDLVHPDLGRPALVRPRLPGRFEPPLGDRGSWTRYQPTERVEESEAEARIDAPAMQPPLRRTPRRPPSPSEPQPDAQVTPPSRAQPMSSQTGPEPTARPSHEVRSSSPEVVLKMQTKKSTEEAPMVVGPPPPEAVSDRPQPVLVEQDQRVRPPISQSASLPAPPAVSSRQVSREAPQAQEAAHVLTIEPVVRRHTVEVATETPADREFMPMARPKVEPLLAQPAPLRTGEERMPPTVQVTIGRVEVRAVFTQPTPQPSAPRPAPTLSLDEYLKQRDGGRL